MAAIPAVEIMYWQLKNSVADPDPKDPHHFVGSRSGIFSTDPDPYSLFKKVKTKSKVAKLNTVS